MEAYAGKSFQMQITFNVFPRVSLNCKLVPAQYWEYEYGLLKSKQVSKQSTNATSQKELGHSFHQGYTDGAYRYGVPGRLVLSLVTNTKLWGPIVDQKLTWVANVLETKKSLAKKLHLLRRSHFYQEEFLF